MAKKDLEKFEQKVKEILEKSNSKNILRNTNKIKKNP